VIEFQLVRTWLATSLRKLPRRDENRDVADRGAGIVETVIIVGLFAAAAIVIVGILVAKATDAANSVKTQ
jgi:hypothetical protein